MVELRLYYDDNGKVLCYTSENLEGNYIVIDANTYAEGRFDLRVVDNKITKASEYMFISKLVKSDSGTRCEPNDICVLTDNDPSTFWEVKINEFRNS